MISLSNITFNITNCLNESKIVKQVIITCISTGGPASTVTWTRDSTITVTEGTETVLDDPETAQYTHTLTVTIGGNYTCSVANNMPFSSSESFLVEGIYIDVKGGQGGYGPPLF